MTIGGINLEDKIYNLAKSLAKKYKTTNPFEIAEMLKIKVMFAPLGKIKGFYHYCIKNKIIYINASLTFREKIVVCAHELGHALLHPKLNIVFLENNTLFRKKRYEIQANLFCIYLLIQDREIPFEQIMHLAKELESTDNMEYGILEIF